MMSESTIEQDLNYYGSTLNEPERGYRPLLLIAAGEISRLKGLQGPVKCWDCQSEIKRSDDWFRCFDCRAHLCENCTKKHFGSGYSAHHERMENYKKTIAMLRDQLAESQLLNRKG
jgi:hypothetical protein